MRGDTLRMWEPGDPIEGGNDTGIPDVKYFDYLKDGDEDDDDYYDNSGYDDYGDYDDYDEYPPKRRGLSFNEAMSNAKSLFDSGNYSESLDWYNIALDIRHDEGAERMKAECLHKLGHDDDASEIYYNLGDRYAYGDSDKQVAVDYFKKALELNQNNEKVLVDLGYVLWRLGRNRQALTYYSRVKHEDVKWNMAMCYMNLKEYNNAIPLFDKVFKANPFRDDFLDQECECYVALNRKSEADSLCKNFIDFLMENECYDYALERIDLLSKSSGNESFIKDKREKCLERKKVLDERFEKIGIAISNYHMYNPNGLDINDYSGLFKFIYEETGESLDNIMKWYATPSMSLFSFGKLCLSKLHYVHWDNIYSLYGEGKFKGL